MTDLGADEFKPGGRDQIDGPAYAGGPRNSLALGHHLHAMVSLDVGGTRYRTTLHTLTAVQVRARQGLSQGGAWRL
jgi:hypothetical protein